MTTHLTHSGRPKPNPRQAEWDGYAPAVEPLARALATKHKLVYMRCDHGEAKRTPRPGLSRGGAFF